MKSKEEELNYGEEEKITEQIELLNELTKVKSSVKKNITEDYVLGHLNKEEREFITENYQNAEYAKELVVRGIKGYKYEFDEKTMDWKRDDEGKPKKIYLTEKEKEAIIKLGERLFEFFMIKPHMITILNRNRSENFLVKLLGKKEEEEQPVMYTKDDRSILEKIRDKLSGNNSEESED